MKKDNKNLTAKQRRDLRQKESGVQTVNAPHDADAPVTAKTEQALPRMNPRKRLLIIIGLIVVEAIIIFLAIFLPIAISPYKKFNNPVAVITLSNGYELEFEIFEEQVPYAATNFIYLAQKKYFEGAIIYDMQSHFIRFGGFRDESYNHRADDLNFAKKISDITAREDGRKFVYRLKTDSSAQANKMQDIGYLSFITSSATEFQLCAMDDASYGNNNGVSFARYLTDDTLEKIQSLYSSVYPSNGDALVHASTVRTEFMLPDTVIKIEKVKIYNLNKDKWRNFNYMEYLQTDKHLYRWEN